LPKSWIVEYRPGEWAYPKVGRLMVFDTIETARAFVTRGSEQIWACEAKDAEPISRVVSPWMAHQPFGYWARRLWAGERIQDDVACHVPPGGLSATAIKLVRRVE
jgi:hypothetical protein